MPLPPRKPRYGSASVLPAWATVAIALGGSFLTAVASIGVAYLTKKHESVAEWRKLMVEVGEDFSTGVGQATRGVREALRLVDEREGYIPPEAVEEAGRLVDVASDRLARVQLLYGSGTRAGKPAEGAIRMLGTAKAGLQRYHLSLREADLAGADDQALRSASGACKSAERMHVEFIESARNSLPGRPYRFLGALRD
jgi:hypothetical protein